MTVYEIRTFDKITTMFKSTHDNARYIKLIFDLVDDKLSSNRNKPCTYLVELIRNSELIRDVSSLYSAVYRINKDSDLTRRSTIDTLIGTHNIITTLLTYTLIMNTSYLTTMDCLDFSNSDKITATYWNKLNNELRDTFVEVNSKNNLHNLFEHVFEINVPNENNDIQFLADSTKCFFKDDSTEYIILIKVIFGDRIYYDVDYGSIKQLKKLLDLSQRI